MIVISDTSPVSNLLLIERLHLLPELFNHVIVPNAVWEELMKLDQFGVNLETLISADWLSIKNVNNKTLVKKLQIDLDSGEAEAIALALELSIEYILIDEKLGRSLAIKHKLHPTGILGLLLEAKRKELIELVKPEMEKLVHQGFYIHQSLYHHLLILAGEE